MSGNTFGTVFKVTTWGESHGNALEWLWMEPLQVYFILCYTEGIG